MSRSDVIAAVCAILLSDWDPIGIRDVLKAQDEYDSYTPAIARLVAEGASAETIARRLIRIETEEMGLQPDPERASRVALKLLQLAA